MKPPVFRAPSPQPWAWPFPAFILVALCVRFLSRYKQSRLVQGAFVGIRPVAVGMIMAGFVMMAETTLLSGSLPDVGSIGTAA